MKKANRLFFIPWLLFAIGYAVLASTGNGDVEHDKTELAK